MTEEREEEQEEIIKQEDIGYLKNWIQLLQGHLYLTPTRLCMTAHYTAGRGGLPVIKRWIEKDRYGFDLEFKDIVEFERGRHGFTTQVIKITNKDGRKWRMMVKNYEEWETAFNEAKGK